MITRMITGIAAGGILLALALGVPTLAQEHNEPCVKCGWEDGANPNWVDMCPPNDIDYIPGSDVIVGIDLNLDCVPETEVVFKGPFDIWRAAPVAGTIEMHIESMRLHAPGDVTLIAGEGLGEGGFPLPPSPGTITQTDPQYADASLNVFFEIELGEGSYGYNHEPLVIEVEDFTCIPPDAVFGAAPGTCLDVYDSPVGGVVIAKVTFSGDQIPPEHDAYAPIPTISEWGLSILALLVLTGGTIVIARRRKAAA